MSPVSKNLIKAMVMTSLVSTMSFSALAQIGPPAPEEKDPAAETKVTQTLSKLFGKKKEAKESEEKAGENAVTPEKTESSPTATPERVHIEGVPPKQTVAEPPKRPPMLSQPALREAKIEQPQVDNANPPVMNHPRLDDPTNPLGFSDAENRLKKMMTLIETHRYQEARPGLVQLRQWLVDSTEAHINLYKTLSSIPSARAQAELEKQLALEFAQLRDRAMLEMGKLYISEKDYSKAVKELIEVIKSQPRSKIGLKSYELLQEIGFTEKLQLAQ